MKKDICFITKKEFWKEELYVGKELRQGIFNLIKMSYPEFSESSLICLDEVNRFRHLYLGNLIKDETGELSNLEKKVLDSIEGNELLTQNIELDLQDDRTRGQKIADKIAAFGGSWVFILSFFGFLLLWIVFNSAFKDIETPDPYPFILLNLLLSCVAAFQAPIIMMSQNRKEQKDRKRSENDYVINLKAELEIKLLHEKIDYLMQKHNNRLIEIQEIQMEMMQDILQKIQHTVIKNK